MKTIFNSTARPITACAAFVVALLAAGCTQDNGGVRIQNPANHQVQLRDSAIVDGPDNIPNARYLPAEPERNAIGSTTWQAGRIDEQERPQNSPGFAAGFGNHGQPEASRARPSLDELMAWERHDMGVRPTSELHGGAMHGATPNQIPGGQVITTKGLLPLLQQGIPVYLFHVLDTAVALPNAIPASRASEPGSFDDQVQQELAQMLQQVTRGNPDAPLVFYCQGPQCWMSYNASLRAIALGYRNVLWYRGGMEAWNQAGQRLTSVQSQG